MERDGVSHVYHLFVVQHPDRDALMKHLQAAGVQCGVHYPEPIHRIKLFESAHTVPHGAPVSERLARNIISLPMYPELDDGSIERVVAALEDHSLVAVDR
jgi:dTDP-4-amino-4,6-dideoxygalactose transaminase